ncbi:hypothetical protein CEUSTIGMA_g9017.t1 [Chlamydomonas eustigma]|uniref:EF-hand domain-containing protein n=1 Tax=Chlamydomonas eustigma TaxID=1157962 RepID=A0A250XFA4_9CHLO|nr:hypothetical protein CEUSTIGMA_g9017.t1 [Chlamydomonas eustigma]|eukprot:GAX81589.1 hypothetical protein CEUSTIGMA_g9017.t1 [Chlamydomonas eustigma]
MNILRISIDSSSSHKCFCIDKKVPTNPLHAYLTSFRYSSPQSGSGTTFVTKTFALNTTYSTSKELCDSNQGGPTDGPPRGGGSGGGRGNNWGSGDDPDWNDNGDSSEQSPSQPPCLAWSAAAILLPLKDDVTMNAIQRGGPLAKKPHILPESRLKAMFDALDQDHNGTIELSELLLAVREGRLGLIHSEKACKEFMAAVAVGNVDSGDTQDVIEYDAFHAYMRQREAVLERMFAMIDENGDGEISIQELKKYLSKVLGRKVPAKEAEAILKSLDSDNNGTINYQELLQGTLLSAGDLDSVFVDAVDYFGHMHLDTKLKDDPSPWRTLIAGFVAGAASRTATAPFDRASILMRAGGSPLAASGNVFGTLVAMWKQGGIPALWSGNTILCLTVAPESAIMFYGYKKFLPMMCPEELGRTPTMLEKLGAGGLAGMVALTAVYPLYVTQGRLAISGPGMFKNLPDFIVKTFKAEGLTPFGRGYIPSILRSFPLKGVELMVYNQLKETFVDPGEQPSVAQSLAFGAVSAAMSNTLTMPLLSLRTKMLGQAPSLGRPVIYDNMIDCIVKTVKGNAALGIPAEGVGGLYKGLSALMMKQIPCTGIQYTSFELVNRMLASYIS